MTLAEFRHEMDAYRRSVDKEAEERKDSYVALDRLHALYRKFDAEERAMADVVLSEWVLSEDENIRFDAQALIRAFQITSAVPALEALEKRLASTRGPGVPHEIEKVRKLAAALKSGLSV